MASAAGGMDIEQVAAENPQAILKEYIAPGMGLEAFQARKIAFQLGLKPQLINQAVQLLTNLYKVFEATDGSLLEINPFITTTDGRLFALDAKINFDDNAMFRHADLKELRDTTEEDPLEVEASKYNLNYIKLDGNVGCMLPVSRIEELPRTSFSLRLTGTTGGAYSRSAEKLPAMLLSIRGAAGSAKLTSRGACSAPTRQTTEKPATTQGAGFQIPTDFDRPASRI